MKRPSFCNFELKESVTRRQVDFFGVSRIPAGNDQAARIWICLNLANQFGNLIDTIAFRIVTAERTPKIPIDWAEIACLASKPAGVLLVGPFGPDVDTAGAQVCLVRVARQEPEQFFRHPAKGHSLGGDDGKAFTQIKASLKSEMRDGADACPVVMLFAVGQNRLEQVVVLFHRSEWR